MLRLTLPQEAQKRQGDMRTERSSPLASPHALFYASFRSLRVALLAATVAVAALNLAGCASVLSKTDRSEPNEKLQREGLVYWLPKRDIKVTVTVTVNDENIEITECRRWSRRYVP